MYGCNLAITKFNPLFLPCAQCSTVYMCVCVQQLPVAPLYGDVQIRFADWVRQLVHYDPSKWTCTTEHMEERATVAIQSRVETIRSDHVRFISDLARYNNEVYRPLVQHGG